MGQRRQRRKGFWQQVLAMWRSSSHRSLSWQTSRVRPIQWRRVSTFCVLHGGGREERRGHGQFWEQQEHPRCDQRGHGHHRWWSYTYLSFSSRPWEVDGGEPEEVWQQWGARSQHQRAGDLWLWQFVKGQVHIHRKGGDQCLQVHALDKGTGPILISVETLRSLGAVIDFQADLVAFRNLDKYKVVPLERSSSGHQLLPLSEDLYSKARNCKTAVPSLADLC